MRAVFDHRRTVFIHDFDGVYYAYQAVANFVDYLCRCGGKAGAAILPSLDHEAATRIHHDSYYAHGMAHVGFLDVAATHGFSERDFAAAYYRDYHTHAYAGLKAECPEWLVTSPSLQYAFRSLTGNVRHGLLTQSCLNEWAMPLLRDYGLLDYFDPNCLLGYEECDQELKSLSTRPLALAMERMNAQPWQTAFIEDSLRNLAKAKELHPDICTVYICGAKPLADLPAFVDIQVDSIERFIQAAVRLHSRADLAPALHR